jgi:hypothetical protein
MRRQARLARRSGLQPMMVINAGEPFPETLGVLLARWAWRYRSELAPAGVAAALVAAAWWLHHTRPQPAGSPARREAAAPHPGASAEPRSIGGLLAPAVGRYAAAAQARGTSATPPPPRGPAAIMDSVPDTPGPQTRTAVTRRIIARVSRGWPRLGEPIVRHRGQFCYVSALLPGHREPTPILPLRYQGSADRWTIGIYLASSGQYTESELPASFGPRTGTPEEGVDDTFGLYPGPRTGR